MVLVNLDAKRAAKHQHEGSLDFERLTRYVVPRIEANQIYRDAVQRECARPKRDGSVHKLCNLALHASPHTMQRFKDGWLQLRKAREG